MAAWDRTKGRPEPIGALNRIRECDKGEPLVDLRIASPSVRLLRPQVIPYARENVAAMCEAAAKKLPAGFYLGLVEAWRPLERQQRIYDFFLRSAREVYPDRGYASLRRTILRWVAPPDQKAPPGHCTGAAVDVHLIDENNERIDVISPYEFFEAAPTYVFGLTEEARRNRYVLVDAMLAAGFSNCRDEWWHYSFGDAGWAVRTGEPDCFYGVATLPRELYEALELEHIESMKERINPFVKIHR